MLCTAADCDSGSAGSWERWANAEELAQFKASGDLGPGEIEARLMVYSCADHHLEPDLAAVTHDADCAAPPTCDCSASGGCW